MSIKITYYVHGTTTDNENHIATGHNQGKLSKLGIQQAQDLANETSKHVFDAICCSDLKRAVDSTKFGFPDKEYITDKRLREVNYGDLNGAPESDVSYSDHINKAFPSGESMKDVEKRIKAFIEYLKNNYNYKHVAIIAHKAPQLALEVIVNKKTWQEAIDTDWRNTKSWQPGWKYIID